MSAKLLDPEMMRIIGRYSFLGLNLTGYAVAGLLVGYVIDRYTGFAWAKIILLIAGFAYGFYQVARIVLKNG